MAGETASLALMRAGHRRVVEAGVSMLAICEKTQAQDLTFMKDEVRAEVGNGNMEKGSSRPVCRSSCARTPRSSTTKRKRLALLAQD